MKCDRCGGLMYYEKFLAVTFEAFSGWRCLVCGEIVDEVILENRNGGPKAVPVGRFPYFCKSKKSDPSKDRSRPAWRCNEAEDRPPGLHDS